MHMTRTVTVLEKTSHWQFRVPRPTKRGSRPTHFTRPGTASIPECCPYFLPNTDNGPLSRIRQSKSSLLPIMIVALAIPLTPHEALSGILGSISIACWIFLLVRPPETPLSHFLFPLPTSRPPSSLVTLSNPVYSRSPNSSKTSATPPPPPSLCPSSSSGSSAISAIWSVRHGRAWCRP
jgi:hypothetical protein